MANWLRSVVFLGLGSVAWAQSLTGLWDATVQVNGITIPFRMEFAGGGRRTFGADERDCRQRDAGDRVGHDPGSWALHFILLCFHGKFS